MVTLFTCAWMHEFTLYINLSWTGLYSLLSLQSPNFTDYFQLILILDKSEGVRTQSLATLNTYKRRCWFQNFFYLIWFEHQCSVSYMAVSEIAYSCLFLYTVTFACKRLYTGTIAIRFTMNKEMIDETKNIIFVPPPSQPVTHILTSPQWVKYCPRVCSF